MDSSGARAHPDDMHRRENCMLIHPEISSQPEHPGLGAGRGLLWAREWQEAICTHSEPAGFRLTQRRLEVLLHSTEQSSKDHTARLLPQSSMYIPSLLLQQLHVSTYTRKFVLTWTEASTERHNHARGMYKTV